MRPTASYKTKAIEGSTSKLLRNGNKIKWNQLILDQLEFCGSWLPKKSFKCMWMVGYIEWIINYWILLQYKNI